ncbi:MAG TPA: phage holin family protein [Abditibacteriaceae bacterium]|jgi:uncharacterized membrane protein YvlD (DUF360 family)
MIPFLIRTAINAAALLLIARLSDGAIIVRSIPVALLVALVLGVAGATVKPILLAVAKGMTCALSCLTLGLWSFALSFLINGLLFWGAAQLLEGFEIKDNNFWTAAFGAFVLACVNVFATAITRGDDDK